VRLTQGIGGNLNFPNTLINRICELYKNVADSGSFVGTKKLEALVCACIIIAVGD
jgi:hypothetical protein